MSTYVAVCLILIGVAFLLGLAAAIMKDEDRGINLAILAGLIAAPTLVALVIYGIVQVNSGPSDEQVCADQGKVWYQPKKYSGICYDQSQYKIVVENQSEE